MHAHVQQLQSSLCKKQLLYTHSVAPTVRFEQSVYTVDEGGESVELVLILSSPISTDISIPVYTTDGSAIGR